MQRIKDFLREIDQRWADADVGRIPLRVIGSAALMLQADYERGTTDSDILETRELEPRTKDALQRIAGVGTPLHVDGGIYLQIVAEAIPFLPQVPIWHAVDGLELAHFEVTVLDIVDVCVSKLKRFAAKDKDDIMAMADLELLPHAKLVERFKLAADMFAYDARAEDLPVCVANLNYVERMFLRVNPTEIELPAWV